MMNPDYCEISMHTIHSDLIDISEEAILKTPNSKLVRFRCYLYVKKVGLPSELYNMKLICKLYTKFQIIIIQEQSGLLQKNILYVLTYTYSNRAHGIRKRCNN
jgi:hypothetical protein